MIAQIGVAKVEVSEGMLDMADAMEEVVAMIRRGEVRACSMCYVEAGPDMDVCSNWASMSGRITMVGGLHRLINSVSDS